MKFENGWFRDAEFFNNITNQLQMYFDFSALEWNAKSGSVWRTWFKVQVKMVDDLVGVKRRNCWQRERMSWDETVLLSFGWFDAILEIKLGQKGKVVAIIFFFFLVIWCDFWHKFERQRNEFESMIKRWWKTNKKESSLVFPDCRCRWGRLEAKRNN